MGYYADDLKDVSDLDLIEEMEDRGYVVALDDGTPCFDETLKQDLHRLWLDYTMIGGDFFDKQLRNFFMKYINKS